MKLYLHHLHLSNQAVEEFVKKIVFDLIEYLHHHNYDGCNLFVGCVASACTLPLLVPLSPKEKQQQDEEGGGSGRKNKPEEERDSFFSLNSQWDVDRLVMRWNAMTDFPTEVMKEMRQTLLKTAECKLGRGRMVWVDVKALPDSIRSHLLCVVES